MRPGTWQDHRTDRPRPALPTLSHDLHGSEPQPSAGSSRTATGHARSRVPDERGKTEGVTPQILEDVTRAPAVKLLGKGNKYRACPLWPETLRALEPFTRSRPMEARVFLNRRKEPLTRSGIYKLVQRTAARASSAQPSIKTKRISPHCLRHACAVHLLRQGVDINTIRGWLGHVSVDTTNIYAEVDLQMKAKALEKCDMPDNAHVKRWHKDPGVIAFLRGL